MELREVSWYIPVLLSWIAVSYLPLSAWFIAHGDGLVARVVLRIPGAAIALLLEDGAGKLIRRS